MNKTVIVSGNRTITDYETVKKAIESSPWFGKMCHIYVGDAKGIDSLVTKWCRENKISFTKFQADWDEWGRQAGPIRNEAMVQEGGEALILIWDGQSKGSASMKRVAEKARLPIYEVIV